mgnify:CR=1 FL=1
MPIVSQILLILFFLSFAHIARKDIRKGIYAAIFFMPLYLVRFAVFGIPTTALEAMICILFFFWLVSIRKGARLCGNAPVFLKEDGILSLGIALLFSGVLAGALVSTDPRASLGVFKGFFAGPFLFFIVYAPV